MVANIRACTSSRRAFPSSTVNATETAPSAEAGDVLGNTMATWRLLNRGREAGWPGVTEPGRPGRPRSQHIPEHLVWFCTSRMVPEQRAWAQAQAGEIGYAR